MKLSILKWIPRIIAAAIMIQTLYFKFSAAPESVYIFTTVGMEPWGRILVGVLELVSSILILLNATAWLGSLLAIGLMARAIGMHLTLLGVEIMDDGGYLFFLALAVLVCSLIVLGLEKAKLLTFVNKFVTRA